MKNECPLNQLCPSLPPGMCLGTAMEGQYHIQMPRIPRGSDQRQQNKLCKVQALLRSQHKPTSQNLPFLFSRPCHLLTSDRWTLQSQLAHPVERQDLPPNAHLPGVHLQWPFNSRLRLVLLHEQCPRYTDVSGPSPNADDRTDPSLESPPTPSISSSPNAHQCTTHQRTTHQRTAHHRTTH